MGTVVGFDPGSGPLFAVDWLVDDATESAFRQLLSESRGEIGWLRTLGCQVALDEVAKLLREPPPVVGSCNP